MVKIATNSTKSTKSRQMTDSERQEIEKLAYQFFVERGSGHGNDPEDWARAEAVVKSRRS